MIRARRLLLAIALLGACGTRDAPEPKVWTSPVRSSAELDILEAVFRYQLGHNEPGDPKPERFLLSLFEGKDALKDPPDELLVRFRGNVPSVEPVSDAGSSIGLDVHGNYDTGGAVVLHLDEIRHTAQNTAEVLGSYFSARWASVHAYVVERRSGRWVVVRDRRVGVL